MTNPTEGNDNDPRLERARALHRTGNIDSAVPIYREILLAEPDQPEALHLLGVATLQCGKPTQAIELLERAVTLAPENPKAQNNLGAALLAAGQLDPAARHFAHARDLAPDFDEAWYNLGRALQGMGRNKEALAHYRKTIELNENHLAAQNNLGTILAFAGHYNEGLAYLRRALRIAPESGEVLSNVVFTLERTNNMEEAAELAKKLVRIAPDVPMARIVRARVARRSGDHMEATRLLDECLASQPDPALQTEALYELSRARAGNGDFHGAFRAVTDAKQLQLILPEASGWDRDEYRQLVRKIHSWSTTENIKSGPSADGGPKEPVFFVGFPRSGTTLLEQILDAHPDLVTTSERTPLGRMLRASQELIGREVNLPDDIEGMDDDELARLRSGFFDVARKVTGDDLSRRRLVDKMPMNIVNLALVNRLFPDAKVLVALRDPRDCCISCYMQQFRPNRAMLNFMELQTTGEFYAAVMDLWLHYRSILTVPWKEYRYEDLVDDFDGTVRGVLDFIGVPWNEAVKNYADHARTKNIGTPSYSAVVKAVNSSAVGRWRNYRDELAPILPYLEPFVEEFGYDPT
jgi:tetratricopeptide (TPR) repeat protein